MNITLSGKTYKNCSVEIISYANGRPAIIIYNDDGHIVEASVNLPDVPVPDGFIAIKNWSENLGILDELIKNNIIEEPKYRYPIGHVSADICKLLIKTQEG